MLKNRALRQKLVELQKEVDRGTNIAPNILIAEEIEQIKSLSTDLILKLKKDCALLDRLHWSVFEHLVAEFFAKRGYEDVRLVGQCPLTSADIYAAHRRDPMGILTRFFIEVKYVKEPCGIEVINRVLGAMVLERPRFGWHAAIIVASV